MAMNLLYAQSGGVTPVINATAAGVIATARAYPQDFGTVFAAKNGIMGVLTEELMDTSVLTDDDLQSLLYTPGGAFGSCRYKLKTPAENPEAYRRILEVFKAHDIGALLYNGGGDSQDTSLKMAQYAESVGYPLQVVGLPKTIDNDLYGTDHCPGFGSVAKYVAISIREAALDLQAMSRSSTQVFILEVMGRHSGWIAAGAGLAQTDGYTAPHLLVFPERPFHSEEFLERVHTTVQREGHAAIVVSEGVRDETGQYLQKAVSTDAFGHSQLGGAAYVISQLIGAKLGYKSHVGVADYLQRAARHIGSETDMRESYGLGEAAVDAIRRGLSHQMLTIERVSDQPYRIQWGAVALESVANREKLFPAEFMDASGYHLSAAGRTYLEPLIQGEAYPAYQKGLPQYWNQKLKCVAPKCAAYAPLAVPAA